MTAYGRFPESVYDRIGSYLPSDQREMFFRYVAHLRVLDSSDPLIVLAEGMAVFTCISRQVPEALAGEREKLLAELTPLCARYEAATANAMADARTMFNAQQKLLEQNLGAWHTKEQQAALALDATARRFEDSAAENLTQLQAACRELQTATREHRAAASKALRWVSLLPLEARLWPYLACAACGSLLTLLITRFLPA